MVNARHIPLRFDVSHAFKAGGLRAGGRAGRVAPAVRRAVFRRDHHRCRSCGFTCKKYQEVLLLKGNARDVDELATACTFCHQCFNLEQVPEMRSGVLVWLPEFTQEQLHYIARDIFRARVTSGEAAERARLAFEYLEARREGARARFGTDEPGALADELRGLSTERQRVELAGRLEGIRLLPYDRRMVREAELEFNMFPQTLAYWRSRTGPFAGETRYQWLDYFERGLAERGVAFPTPAASGSLNRRTHAELAAKLLRDAAGFFRTLGGTNAPVQEQMEENARVYERVAELLLRDPTGSTGSTGSEGAGGVTYAGLAAKLLRDAAGFLLRLGEQNAPLREQMLQNASVYKRMASLVEKDPTGYLD